jgi:hypothetical protein
MFITNETADKVANGGGFLGLSMILEFELSFPAGYSALLCFLGEGIDAETRSNLGRSFVRQPDSLAYDSNLVL